MEKEEQKWEQGLEDEEKEEETLQVRRSRARTKGSPIRSGPAAQDQNTSQSNGNGTCESNEHMIQPSESVAENEFDESFLDEQQEGPEKTAVLAHGGFEKGTIIIEGHSNSENCVYYDKDEGLWKCQFCCWTYGCTSLCSDVVQIPNGHLHEPMIFKTLNQSVQGFNSEIEEHIETNPDDYGSGTEKHDVTVPMESESAIEYQDGVKQEDENLSNIWPSNILPEERSTSYKSSKTREVGNSDVDVINESDLEVMEVDVEKVLQNQKTHDLYCPNCNSCITRRIILRKRKRHVHITSEDVKRNKIETEIGSEVNDNSGLESSDQGHEKADTRLDATSELATNDNEHDQDPDIFRCLSCFSIFIPTGNGFKLFKIFGDQGKNTLENQQKSTTSKNWISSIFTSDKQKTTIRPGSAIEVDALKTKSEVCMPPSNLNDPKGTAESDNDGDEGLHSSILEELGKEKLKLNVEDNSSDDKTATLKRDAGDSAMNNFGVAAGSQPDTSDIPKDVVLHSQIDKSVTSPANRLSVSEGGSSDNTTSADQPDGLKLLIALNVGSTTTEKLHGDQKPQVEIQNSGVDKESILSLPTIDSTLEELNTKGDMNVSVDISHEHESEVGAKITDESVCEKGTNFELSNGVAGKDTIIVVESVPVRTAASEQPQDLNMQAEVETLPHLDSHIHVMEPMTTNAREAYRIEIMKSIVYGGLSESITSLGVVSSAAGGDTATLNVLALAFANLISGLVFTYHSLRELKKDQIAQAPNQVSEQTDRYRETLGLRENFSIHATVALLSFLLFGLIPPITYGFSFRISDDRELKLLAAGAASLVCIILLAAGKAYVRKPPKSYLKTVMYYVLMGFMVSGISYAAGELIKRLLERLHLFQSNSLLASLHHPETTPYGSGRASY